MTDGAMTKWRPIETAPKDGTIIQLWAPQYPEVVIGWWTGDHRFPWSFIDETEEIVTGCCDDEEPGRVRTNAFRAGHGPTLWMPLAEPPEARSHD